MSSYGKKQLEVIRDFGRDKLVLHSSCMGTGKTYAICAAFIVYCAMMERLGIKGLNFVLLGESQATVKRNVCNILSALASEDFRYSMSRSDGISRDAMLFSHNIYIVGLTDNRSVERLRGISQITAVIQEEVALMTSEEHYALILSRLRGEYDKSIMDKWPEGYCLRFWIGSTNPGAPNHFIKRKVDAGEIKMVEWSQEDAKYQGAKDYFEDLRKLYAGMPALYDRNVLGKWTSAEGAVYTMFNPKIHILKGQEVDLKKIQYTIISVDYGSNHPTAILLIAKTYDSKYIVYKEIKLQRTAPSTIINIISQEIDNINENGGTIATYGVIVDPSAVGLKDEMDEKGLLYTEAYNRHSDGIAYVGNLFSECRLAIFDECKNLINEIYTYKYKPNSIKDEVVKINDDFVDALRYGVYTDFKEG